MVADASQNPFHARHLPALKQSFRRRGSARSNNHEERTMRLTAIKISGYASGQTNFAPVFNSSPEIEREQILSVVERIADAIIDPDNRQFTSIIIVGHSDRQDRADIELRSETRQRDRRRARSRLVGVGLGEGAGHRAARAIGYYGRGLVGKLAARHVGHGLCRSRHARIRSAERAGAAPQPARRHAYQHVRLRIGEAPCSIRHPSGKVLGLH